MARKVVGTATLRALLCAEFVIFMKNLDMLADR